MDWTWGWSAVAAIATCVLAIGIWFAFLQLRQARKNTNAQLAIDLLRELRSTQTKETLRSIIYELKPEDIKSLTGKKKEKIDQVLDWFDMLAALVDEKIIDERLAIEAFAGPPVLRCWFQLGEYYIEGLRNERGLFCKNIKHLAKRTVKYQLIRHPKIEWVRFHRGILGEEVNLVEHLRDKLLSKTEFRIAKFKRTLRSVCNPSLREKI